MTTIIKGISNDYFKIVYNNRAKLKFLFSVKATESKSSNQKFDLHLQKEMKSASLAKAKEYVFALSTPECQEEITIENPAIPILTSLFWLEAIEKCYGVFLERVNKTGLRVAGTEAKVQLVRDDLKSLEHKLAQGSAANLSLDGSNALNWKITKLVTRALKRRHPTFCFADFSHHNDQVKEYFLKWLTAADDEGKDSAEEEEEDSIIDAEPPDESVILIENTPKANKTLIDLTKEEDDNLNDSVIFLSFEPADQVRRAASKRKRSFTGGNRKKRSRTKAGLFTLNRWPSHAAQVNPIKPLPAVEQPSQAAEVDKQTPPQLDPAIKQPQSKAPEVINLKEEDLSPLQLRPIVIDGSNVARTHGGSVFSCKGIKLVIDYFLNRGHTDIKAFVPQYMRKKRPVIPTTDQHLLEDLHNKGYVVFTPSRTLGKQTIASYDDRYIVSLAAKNGGVIVSNDNYRDIIDESPDFNKTIRERLLMYCIVGDFFMPPEDPLGRMGPKLNDFLKFPPGPKS